MHLTFAGKRYEFRFVPNAAADGYCDPPTNAGKKILVRQGLRGVERLHTMIHEFLHASLWDLDEEAVDRVSGDIGKALWRLGYRGPKDEE